jgi:hypothetical protein
MKFKRIYGHLKIIQSKFLKSENASSFEKGRSLLSAET